MDYKKGDYAGLIERISTATDKAFTDRQARTVMNRLEAIGWEASYRVSSKIERAPNVPKNVYGMVLNMIDEEDESVNKKVLTREDWLADPDCASPEEFEMTMKCISFCCMFKNSVELCNMLSNGMTGSFKKDVLLEYLHRFYNSLLEMKKNRSDLIRENMPMRID